ncbi:programmed cell death protein [Kappamyces sp. JEL0680]|nr:programmed cell death protein [Kappamyces sp. JEL0680]
MLPIQLAFPMLDEQPEPQPRKWLIENIYKVHNHVGGKPLLLDPFVPWPRDKCVCQVCAEPMVLLLQLYCPEDYPEVAFHRMIYVFCCKRGSCHAGRTSSGFAILRSQLPLKNPLYDMDGQFQAATSAIETDYSLSVEGLGKTQFCCICGVPALSMCGQCHARPYCSKSHQALDWTQGMHKELCQSQGKPSGPVQDWLDCFVYPLLYLEEDEEPEKGSADLAGLSLHAQAAIENVEEGDADLEEEQETETDVDKAFLKFQKRISLAPDQVLRYGRVMPDGHNEPPLWVSSAGIAAPSEIPCCPSCKAPRTFEFQIMPQLLVHLGLDHKDANCLDWGTVVFYTCSQHCQAANGSYAVECYIKQDFSADGMGDSVRKEMAALEQARESH